MNRNIQRSILGPSAAIAPCVAAALTLTAPAAQAQTYGLTTGSGALSSIRLTGTQLSFSSQDDGSASFAMPFAFDFFGTEIPDQHVLYANTNGALHFGGSSGASSLSNQAIPSTSSPNNLIAGYWTDMEIGGGGVFWQVSGVTGARVLAVEWNNVEGYNSPSDTITYQIRIHEADDHIEIIYGPSAGTGRAATVGAEGPRGVQAAALPCTPSCTFADLGEGTLLTFTPMAVPPPSTDLEVTFASQVPSSVSVGQMVSIDFTVSNTGTELAAASSAGLYVGPTSPATPQNGTLATETRISGIVGGGTGNGTFVLEVPPMPAGTTLYASIVADYEDEVLEVDEMDNLYPLGAFTIGGQTMGTITITTRTLPPARVGDAYAATLQQTGATSPSWTVVSGQLPSGVTMSSAGEVAGTPSAEGQFGLRVEASQTGYTAGYADLVLTVSAAGGLSIDTSALPEATVGQAYSAMLTGSGGTPPYAFQGVSGVPMWMTVSSDGAISGTPDVSGSHDLNLSLFDSVGGFASATLRLEVVEGGPLRMVTTAGELPAGQTGVAYSFTVRASGGTRPHSFVVSGGTLPAGLALATDGSISGTPSAAGDSSFEITASDAAGGSAMLSATISITEQMALHITLADTIRVRFGSPVDYALTAGGGTPPYQWGISMGTLPAGLALVGDRIQGVATSSTAQTLTFTVVDAVAATAMATVTVHATNAPTNGGSSGGGARGGRSRDSGCTCVVAPQSEGAHTWGALLVLCGFALVLPGWRRRRFRVQNKACSSVVTSRAYQDERR